MVGLCRLCASLRKRDNLITLKNDSSNLCEKLLICCQLDIKMCDDLPKSICKNCFENLNNCYSFYAKVKEAQDTLNALFSSKNNIYESTNVCDVKLSVAEGKSSVVPKGNSNPKSSGLKEDDTILTTESKRPNTKPLKQVLIENYALRPTQYSIKVTQDEKNMANMAKARERNLDDEGEMYILEISKGKVNCGSNSVVKETFEANVEDKTDNYGQQQLINENNDLDESSPQINLDISNGIGLQGNGVEHVNNIVPYSELKFRVEYMDYFEDDQEDNDKLSLPVQLKLKSWKNYKFICYICDDTFSTFIHLKNHIIQQHNAKQADDFQYKCYDCKKVIPRYNFFLNHVRSKHHNDLKLKCDVCDLSCKNYQDLAYHRSADCSEAVKHAYTVPCNKCFKTFHNIYGLHNHIRYQHSCKKDKLEYTCMQCNKEFQFKSSLKLHEQMHTGAKCFCCNYCERSFFSRFSLERHLHTHVNEKIYQCNICYKSYKTFQSLDEHKKLHTKEKSFKCQFCEKCFSQKVQKVTHERSHTGEMPYPCERCDKRFRYSSALFAHSKVHTGSKPYACEHCGKTFADSSNRNKHVRHMHLSNESKNNKKKEK